MTAASRPALPLLFAVACGTASALPATPDEVIAPEEASYAALSQPLEPADLRALADLDGDPGTITAEEEEMYHLLLQVVTGMPVAPAD